MRSHIQQRNRDFIRQCKKSAQILSGQGAMPSVEEVVRHALSQKAPCYYVDYYRATSRLSKADCNSDPGAKRYASYYQWVDMAADLALLRAKHPSTHVNRLILDLCAGRAGNPRFYISPRRAIEMAEIALKSA